jgi:hypothetical protein
MSKLVPARVAAGAAAPVVVCAVIGAMGVVTSCAAIWDIEQPLPWGGDGGGADAGGADVAPMDSTIPTEEETSVDTGPGDTLRRDADSASSDEPGPPPGYVITQLPSPTFVDACLLTGAAKGLIPNHNYADTGVVTLAIPFDFYGVPQTEYWANTQGIVGFGTRNVHNANVVCPLPSPTHIEAHPAIYAFADNIQTGTAGVCIGVTGVAPMQELVVTWEDASLVSDSSSHLTFSVVLTEGTNTIDLLYKTMTGSSEAQGTLAMIGVEDASGMFATMFSCMHGSPVIPSTPFGLHFTPTP